MLRRARVFLALVAALGCSPSSAPSTASPDASPWADVELIEVSVPEGGAFMVSVIEASTPVVDPSGTCGVDASADTGIFFESPDGGPDAGPCAAPLAPGDLMMDEVMISSVSGSADRGQWLEVHNVRACNVDLIGLHAEAPTGSSFHTLDVTEDVWIPAGGFFVIADSLDPTMNNDLPGLALTWSVPGSDILHKTEDTVTLSVGTVTIDTLTYHPKEGLVAISMAFPANCAPSLRSDFANWQESTASWTQGFYGTPNAPNTDVRCSVAAAAPLCVVNPSSP